MEGSGDGVLIESGYECVRPSTDVIDDSVSYGGQVSGIRVPGNGFSSLSRPSARVSLVGCDHLVPMDAALMTAKGV